MMANLEFTLWLVPREPLRSALRATIHRLAESLDAVAFEPHVTVYCGPSSDAEAQSVVDRIAGQFSPIELVADGLSYTELFTKTLFVQFRESATLRRMFETAAANVARPSGYVLNPHLSLLYKRLPQDRQRELCETLDVPTGKHWFDRVRIVETELPIEDAGPVRRWRTVCEAELTAGP